MAKLAEQERAAPGWVVAMEASIAHPELARLFEAGAPDAERVEAFVDARAVPLVEPGQATFVFHGPAEKVELLRWIAGVERAAFVPVPGTDFWILRIAVEDGGRFEYKLAVTRDGHEHWVLDPLNPFRAGDPFGENSVCRTHGYRRPDWTVPKGAPAGEIVPLTVSSRAFGETRHERVYLPAGHDPATAYPVVIVHDGDDYDEYAGLSISLDNLIADGDVPPLIAVLVQTTDRTGEYPRGRRHARYLAHELLPAVEARFAIAAAPAKRVLLGASLGAVASLVTAFRCPGVFGGLVLKSGTFILDQSKLATRPGPVFWRAARVAAAIARARPLPPMRAFVSTGELEGLAPENRAMAELLRTHGVDVLYKSAWDGHHWHNWRDQLRDGLMWVLETEK